MRVVALHGFLGHSSDFGPLQKILDKRISRYQLWAPDLFSAEGDQYLPKVRESWPASFHRQHMQEVPFTLKPLPGSARILLGYSFGGRLAIDLFFSKPEIWDHLFLISANPGFLNDHDRTIRTVNDQKWAERFAKEKWSDVVADWNSQAVFKDSFEPDRFEGDFSRETLALALERYSLAQMTVSREQLKQQKEKIKWVVGEKDLKLTSLYSNLKQDGIIQNLEIIKDSGHRTLFDQPEAVAELLVRAAKL